MENSKVKVLFENFTRYYLMVNIKIVANQLISYSCSENSKQRYKDLAMGFIKMHGLNIS